MLAVDFSVSVNRGEDIATMTDSVDRVFVHALNTVKKLPRTGTSRPPPNDRLKLYGLYKQSMEGDVTGVMARPEDTSTELGMTETKKWDAWNDQKGLSRTEAKRRYIQHLIDAMHRYAASSPDARELLAELEFVWNQIKSNSSSNSSSPPNPSTTPQPRSIDTSSASLRNSHGLSILPPMSPEPEDFHQAGHIADNDDDDDDDDEHEHYETMDEFDNREKGLVILPRSERNRTPASAPSPRRHGSVNEKAAEMGGSVIIPKARQQRFQSLDDTLDTPHAASSVGKVSRAASTRATTTRGGAGNGNGGNGGNGPPGSTKWRRSVEQALTKMTAEVAALREQLESRRSTAAAARTRLALLRRWVVWMSWVAVKHVFFDSIIIGVILLWMKRKGDKRAELVIKLLGGFLSEKIGWTRRQGKKMAAKALVMHHRPSTPSIASG